MIRGLRDAGKAIIYISHRMEEIRAIADRFTVMRDGKVVATDAIERYTDAQLNELIAGRELSLAMEGRPAHLGIDGAPLIELRGLSTIRVHNIDLSVRPGEVVGLAGLVGSGRSAIIRAVFEIDQRTGGEIWVAGSAVNIKEPKDAMRAGIALIPEDRRGHAIVPMMSVEQNFGLANQKRFTRFGVLRGAARRAEARIYASDLQIRPPNILTPMANISGRTSRRSSSRAGWPRAPAYSCLTNPLAASTLAQRPRSMPSPSARCRGRSRPGHLVRTARTPASFSPNRHRQSRPSNSNPGKRRPS